MNKYRYAIHIIIILGLVNWKTSSLSATYRENWTLQLDFSQGEKNSYKNSLTNTSGQLKKIHSFDTPLSSRNLLLSKLTHLATNQPELNSLYYLYIYSLLNTHVLMRTKTHISN